MSPRRINERRGEQMIMTAPTCGSWRHGRRDRPDWTSSSSASSRFFGVSPSYFFDEAETERGTIPPEVALALRDDAVRDIALRSADQSLKAIADMVTSARAGETSRPPGPPQAQACPAEPSA